MGFAFCFASQWTQEFQNVYPNMPSMSYGSNVSSVFEDCNALQVYFARVFVSLSDNREIFIYSQEFIYRRTERKTHWRCCLHTLQRVSLKTEMFLPSSVPRSHSTTSMGLQPRWGDPVGKWVSPFSLSLSTPFHSSDQNDSLSWSSWPVFVWSIISGSTFALRSKLGAMGGKKNRGREKRNSPPDPPCLGLFVPSLLCLLPFAFWTLQVAALCTLFMFWFHPERRKRVYFLHLTWNQNCPRANFWLKVLKVLIWGKTLEKIYEVPHAMIKMKKTNSLSVISTPQNHMECWSWKELTQFVPITSFSLCLLS